MTAALAVATETSEVRGILPGLTIPHGQQARLNESGDGFKIIAEAPAAVNEPTFEAQAPKPSSRRHHPGVGHTKAITPTLSQPAPTFSSRASRMNRHQPNGYAALKSPTNHAEQSPLPDARMQLLLRQLRHLSPRLRQQIIKHYGLSVPSAKQALQAERRRIHRNLNAALAPSPVPTVPTAPEPTQQEVTLRGQIAEYLYDKAVKKLSAEMRPQFTRQRRPRNHAPALAYG